MGIFLFVIATFEVVIVALAVRETPNPASSEDECDSGCAS